MLNRRVELTHKADEFAAKYITENDLLGRVVTDKILKGLRSVVSLAYYRGGEQILGGESLLDRALTVLEKEGSLENFMIDILEES
jgi:hypothetical protein